MQWLINPLLLAAALSTGAAAAASQPRPAVVELYTSEGCSSCPPAEAYIGELAQRADVLALSFHVDYWDNLGWPDRYALPDSVWRQRAYAKTLARGSVYTPQVVIDGRGDFVGSDRLAIGRDLSAAREGVAVGIAVGNGSLTIHVGTGAAVAAEVLLVGYQHRAVTKIGRGENGGRTLEEFNVVRVFRTLGAWDGQAQQYQARVDSLPPGTTDVAILIQPTGQGPILGAATVPLS